VCGRFLHCEDGRVAIRLFLNKKGLKIRDAGSEIISYPAMDTYWTYKREKNCRLFSFCS